MEAVGILAGGIAHDFNNLLTTILGQTELSLERMEKDNPVRANLEESLQASLRAAGLTRQLLLFSRRQPMDLVKINVNRTIDNLLKMLRRFIGEDVALRTNLDPGLWTVRADEGNIEQVLINLAVNARDAMPEGGALKLRTENVLLETGDPGKEPEAEPGRYVLVTIEDTGVGMDQETLERIFEPFFSTKAAGKGTGLGLSVVYGIIKQHGGWIGASSSPGEGTAFRIYLPAISGLTEEITYDEMKLEDYRGRGEKILLVEDGLSVRNFAVKALRGNGYEVVEAGSASEAFEAFERWNEEFDIVFCDVVLPDRNGLQVVEELMNRKPGIRILLTSGYVDHKVQWPIIRERGFRFLQKPYTLMDLLTHIREVLDAG
jgi:CheY-like chemotaxis protein